jgi:ATP-dependent helicase/nuclease subunit A
MKTAETTSGSELLLTTENMAVGEDLAAIGLTHSQAEAVRARGNVLVVAGAGTGKTRTLVERCLHCLLHERPGLSLDEILVVTFTEAAAAEIRQRIRQRLEQQVEASPNNARFAEQLALFETAHIGTLHSFCLDLIREHFYLLNVDPQLAVLAEGEARLLAEETLDRIFERHYAGGNPISSQAQQLIQSHGRGWDKPIRALILRLHRYAQSLAQPGTWLNAQAAMFADPQRTPWADWLFTEFPSISADWRAALELEGGNPVAEACLRALASAPPVNSSKSLRACLDALEASREACPEGRKGAFLHALQGFFGDVQFLRSVLAGDAASDPLIEDWSWTRPAMRTLIQLAVEFEAAFTEAKRELGCVDFQDLEQLALRLLREPGQVSPPTSRGPEKAPAVRICRRVPRTSMPPRIASSRRLAAMAPTRTASSLVMSNRVSTGFALPTRAFSRATFAAGNKPWP